MTKLRYLALALPLAVAGWWWSGRSTPAVHADTQVARPSVLIAPGRVEPVRDPVRLAFEAQGRIAEILVDEGDTVHAGQVLARLDDRLPAARVAAAEAGLAQARARLAFARRGPRAEDLAAARADADAAAAAARHRGAEQARSEHLGKVGALATTVVDADDAAARVATAQATAASARYQSLARGTRSEQVDEAAAAVALAQAELDAARVALDQTVLRAPSDGVILRRTGEVGALVTLMAPAPVVSMADLGQLELRAEIDEADLAAVTLGQTAYATAEAYGDRRFPVVLGRLTRELGRKTARDDDPRARVDTRVLEVIARFDGAPGIALPLGLRMQLHVTK
ncbi:MAG: biotin/lipoyl-binding protein [Deltaproteobacteria bacterium]|nr:MAG: biotin/lipoyl-binding protein [Deltaproteobacteria bacterium]